MADETNPQGIASQAEKDARYRAALEYEKEGYEAQVKAAERYGDDAKLRVAKAVLLDIDEELAKLDGASEDEAAAPKKAAASRSRAKKPADGASEDEAAEGDGADDA